MQKTPLQYMQLQVDFAYWKCWGLVRDFARRDDLSAQGSTLNSSWASFFLHFKYLWLNSGNRCGLQVWEIFNLWTFSKQTAQIYKDLEDSYVV